jgi:hypothetical protein
MTIGRWWVYLRRAAGAASDDPGHGRPGIVRESSRRERGGLFPWSEGAAKNRYRISYGRRALPGKSEDTDDEHHEYELGCSNPLEVACTRPPAPILRSSATGVL